MGSVGILEGKLLLNAQGWSKGLDSARISVGTFRRAASKMFAYAQTDVDKYNQKIAEMKAVHAAGYVSAGVLAASLKKIRGEAALAGVRIKGVTVATIAFAKAQHLAVTALRSGRMALSAYIGPLAVIYGAYRSIAGVFKTSEMIDRAMHESLAIMKRVGGKMRAEMKEVAFDVAFSTKYSIEEAGKAYYYLTSAGLDVQQLPKALPVTAKFAQAGMFDLSRATDLLTDAQMAMGLSSKDAVENQKEMIHVAEVLVKANQLANATVEQFSLSLTNKGAASARLFDQSLEDVVSIMAVYASQGVKSEEAGSRFEITMKHLVILAKENTTAFKAMGVAVYNQAGKVRYLGDILADLEKSLMKVASEERVGALMQAGFTRKTMTAIAALLGFSDAAKEFRAELQKHRGALESVYGKQLTEFQKGWHKLSASMAQSSGRIQQMTDDFGGLMGAIGELIKWLDKLDQSSPAIASLYDKWKEARSGPEEFVRGIGARVFDLQNMLGLVEDLTVPKPVEEQSGMKKITEGIEAGKGLLPEGAIQQQKDIESWLTKAAELGDKLKFDSLVFNMSPISKEITKLEEGMKALGVTTGAEFEKFRQLIKEARRIQAHMETQAKEKKAWETSEKQQAKDATLAETQSTRGMEAARMMWRNMEMAASGVDAFEQKLQKLVDTLRKLFPTEQVDRFIDRMRAFNQALEARTFGENLARSLETINDKFVRQSAELERWDVQRAAAGDGRGGGGGLLGRGREMLEAEWMRSKRGEFDQRSGLIDAVAKGSAEAYRAVVGGGQESRIEALMKEELREMRQGAIPRALRQLVRQDARRPVVEPAP